MNVTDWLPVLQSSPAVVAVIVTVGYFMRFLREERTERQTAAEACHEAHRQIQERSNEVASRATTAILECSKLHGEAASALMALALAHRRPQ